MISSLAIRQELGHLVSLYGGVPPLPGAGRRALVLAQGLVCWRAEGLESGYVPHVPHLLSTYCRPHALPWAGDKKAMKIEQCHYVMILRVRPMVGAR